jgi:hypothetical protein
MARDSRASVPRTVWMSDRSMTIAPTPIATHTKKNSRRFQDARISRSAIRMTNFII